ncbi:MAG TPA: hypothetical protein DCZ92_15280 [Elusimicrobia bacterium]|nr:MAG: hypothetical protein A2016_03135 [Elusimicrobia bacterium GWF2_62_30]HBA62142.1 hypothetical protein [Elusimicrobiota bacterium]
MKPRYQIVISLSEEDNVQLTKLREEGYQIVDIFRLGLTEAEGALKKQPRAKKPHQDKLF